MDTTIRNLDEQGYRAIQARAVMQGRNVGDLLNEAMHGYLARLPLAQPTSSLRALEPEAFPEGNEHLSQVSTQLCMTTGGRDRPRFQFPDRLLQ
jgi:plasmid stability protein